MRKNYKKKYRILSRAVISIVRNLKHNIYNDKLPPVTLRYMSDLKYYLLLSFYCDKNINNNIKKIKVKVRKK